MVTALEVTRPSLKAVLAYRNRDVVDRFVKHWDVTHAEARMIFQDMLRYLWAATDPTGEALSPVPIIDEMWHTFLMFTAEYSAFGRKYFGRVVDHEPTTEREWARRRKKQDRNPEGAKVERATWLAKQVATVYDKFGARVTARWYVTYYERYGRTFFRTKAKPIDVEPIRVSKRLRELLGSL